MMSTVGRVQLRRLGRSRARILPFVLLVVTSLVNCKLDTLTAPLPAISGIIPSVGGVAGGTEVTIDGTNYSADSRVTIGGAPPLSFKVVDSRRIVAITAPHSAGSADVVVTSGETRASLQGGFTYLPAQTISGTSPLSGSSQGGTPVTITGSNFVAGSIVTIGGVATNVHFVDALHMTAVTTAHAAGPADVVISSPAGSAMLSAAFTYVLPPPPVPTALQQALTARYLERFSESMPWPALYNNFGCGGDHVTTTAYLNSSGKSASLLSLYTSSDGGGVARQSRGTVVKPAGVFRVLVVLVGYSQTVIASGLAAWEAAQAQINADHATFAAARGYDAPLVIFDNTNALVAASEVADPRSPAGVSAALALQGVSVTGYDFVVSVNMDPSRSDEGGFAVVPSSPAFIYMGNFGHWTAPLTSAQYTSIAGAVYHHEVAHHWGWPGTHDWASCMSGANFGFNFRVPPELFGWEDTDHDGVPEILDPSPYGRGIPRVMGFSLIATINLRPHPFHGEWNYTIRPRRL